MEQTTLAEQTEFMGFRVEWKADGLSDESPCIFHGKRGAQYAAIRTRRNPEWCFMVDVGPNRGPAIRKIHGNGWVKIPKGERRITEAQ